MNLSVSRANYHRRFFRSVTFHFRLAPRRGVRYSEGESDGQKYDLILHSQADY